MIDKGYWKTIMGLHHNPQVRAGFMSKDSSYSFIKLPSYFQRLTSRTISDTWYRNRKDFCGFHFIYLTVPLMEELWAEQFWKVYSLQFMSLFRMGFQKKVHMFKLPDLSRFRTREPFRKFNGLDVKKNYIWRYEDMKSSIVDMPEIKNFY